MARGRNTRKKRSPAKAKAAAQPSPISIRPSALTVAQANALLSELEQNDALLPGVARNRHALLLAALDAGLHQLAQELPPRSAERVQLAVGAEIPGFETAARELGLPLPEPRPAQTLGRPKRRQSNKEGQLALAAVSGLVLGALVQSQRGRRRR